MHSLHFVYTTWYMQLIQTAEQPSYVHAALWGELTWQRSRNCSIGCGKRHISR